MPSDDAALFKPEHTKHKVSQAYLDSIQKELDRDAQKSADREPRFVHLTASDFIRTPPPITWLVNGIWPDGGFGAFGGPKKTLKTYNVMALAIAVASGKPLFGRYVVPHRRHVVMYVSEGSKRMIQQRLRMLAEAMGITGRASLRMLSRYLHIATDAAPIGSPTLSDAIARDKAKWDVGLLILDALYGFHPQDIENSDLYQRGQMFVDFQREVVTATCGLILVDHFSKSRRNEHDLDGFSQSGMEAWSGSWCLLEHNKPPRVKDGRFVIKSTFAGRDGYETSIVVRWDVGVMDPEQHISLGPVTFEVLELEAAAEDRPVTGGLFGDSQIDIHIQALILRLVELRPYTYTKTDIRGKVAKVIKVREAEVTKQYGYLVAEGYIEDPHCKPPGNEGAQTAARAGLVKGKPHKWHLRLKEAETTGEIADVFTDLDTEEEGQE